MPSLARADPEGGCIIALHTEDTDMMPKAFREGAKFTFVLAMI